MFKRFWQRMNDWAAALNMDDPHGDYLIRLEDRVSRLERAIEGLGTMPEPETTGSVQDRIRRLHH
ncbi:hypothetical protein [Bradyrhizobium sp. SZCCHNS3002]|uniref:hypothetical protein n=1 Tax=Bradyrhizobium sp. SZCCHNS3002 TaxID=3057310 RepID=UPI0028E8D1F3|nr:hypothetical protein [Bradyrhizobium sp. SZCCHNS3002]